MIKDDYNGSFVDRSTKYALMCEIKCRAGVAKMYMSCYERDKVLVFAFGSGDDDK